MPLGKFYGNELKYWLCITNRENWEIVKKRKIWGVPRRRRATIENAEPADFLVFYIMHKKIGGIFEVVSKAFKSEKEVFKPIKGEIFPYRVKIKAVVIPRKPINFRGLIPKLTFIKNKKMWTGYLRAAMRTIPKSDFRTIETAISFILD
jgi:predicted RNA-binding protein